VPGLKPDWRTPPPWDTFACQVGSPHVAPILHRARLGIVVLALATLLATTATAQDATGSPSGASADSEATVSETEVGAVDLPAPEELAGALERIAKQEFDLERALEAARLDLDSARRRFEAAQARLDAETDPTEALRAEVAARRLQLESTQRVAALLEGRLTRLDEERQGWRRLHALARGTASPADLAAWLAESEQSGEDLARERSVKSARLEDVEQDVGFMEEKAQQGPPGSPAQRWNAAQAQALAELAEQYQADLASLATAQELEARLSAALARENEQRPLSSQLLALLYQAREAWNYELVASEPEPITPGKILGALVIFLIGWLLARQISRLMGSRLFPRLRVEEGAAQAFQSLVFYFLVLVAVLTALRMVQIPLTAFAVVGGALAIGVGFGSQNVVNNFISGIILLAERPIKRGDLIELGGVYGNVESIGLRSTRVRTGDNVHIIVPNAAFLESNVVNWTHSDRRVRLTIAVGIAYGSPTREAERLIQQAVHDQPEVLAQPPPVVLFCDFGDNALGFEARFWIEMRTVLQRLQVESAVRFRIDEMFREAGITIAFPQRDVHLDTLSPVEVRLVEGGPPGPGHDPGA